MLAVVAVVVRHLEQVELVAVELVVLVHLLLP
jgi:hypothetical protein